MAETNGILEKLKGRRIIPLGNDIKRESADEVRKELLRMALESNDEIRLVIDSGGGQCTASFSICDAIACLDAPVIGIVVGKCASMAVTILQCCTRRLALANASFFLHYISACSEVSLHLSDDELKAYFERRVTEGRAWQARNEQILAGRAGCSVEDVRKLMRNGDVLESRLSTDEAKRYGLIDYIADPKLVFADQSSQPTK